MEKKNDVCGRLMPCMACNYYAECIGQKRLKVKKTHVC